MFLIFLCHQLYHICADSRVAYDESKVLNEKLQKIEKILTQIFCGNLFITRPVILRHYQDVFIYY